MIVLNPADSRPLYEQITEKFKNLIIGGYLKENDRIPSVRELASKLAINPNTIQKAYKELEAEGYIVAKPARGYFVNTKHENDSRTKILTDNLENLLKELYFLDYPEKDLLSLIDKIYKGGKNND